MGRAREEEERNEGVSDLAQPCIFLVKTMKARGQLIRGQWQITPRSNPLTCNPVFFQCLLLTLSANTLNLEKV